MYFINITSLSVYWINDSADFVLSLKSGGRLAGCQLV